ncbi:MAG: class A beta-lactamase [Sphingomonadales bacterium]
MLTRRDTLALGSAASFLALLPARLLAAPAERLKPAVAVIEKRVAGRLGVAVLDTATGQVDGHRADERFAMCSTFKFLAAAHVLGRADKGAEDLSRRIDIPSAPLIAHSPVTGSRAGRTMNVLALCEAAMTISDNTAANLLLDSFGGPAGLTAWLRSLGDGVTRLDRTEPDLNEAAPGDPRDTTSPAAMTATMRRLLLGDVLTPDSRARLTGWLIGNQTGSKRIRAGLPGVWRVGDKTGSGANGATNDIAILWPPGRAPLLVAVYLTETTAPAAARDAVHADVARLIGQ